MPQRVPEIAKNAASRLRLKVRRTARGGNSLRAGAGAASLALLLAAAACSSNDSPPPAVAGHTSAGASSVAASAGGGSVPLPSAGGAGGAGGGTPISAVSAGSPSAGTESGGSTSSSDASGAGGRASQGSAGLGAGGAPPEPPTGVPACTRNRIAECSGSPLACHFGGIPGNYSVTVELGGAEASDTQVEAETARRMLTQTTAAGVTKRFSFVTNVRVYEGEPLRPDQDGTTSKGTPGLDVYFRGTSPGPASICYEATDKPLMLWVEGDSTVCDQTDPDYSGWAQHLPQHFLSPISVANYADSGESSSSVLGSAKLWPTIKAGLKAGDWVMVQLGHNDKDTPAANFKANLTRMVSDVKAANAHMILITPISRVGYALAAEHVNSTGANLPQIIRDLGASENVPVIDLTVTSWNWLQTIKWQDYFALGTDHTHTNHRGADVVSGFVRDAVRKQIPELAKYLR